MIRLHLQTISVYLAVLGCCLSTSQAIDKTCGHCEDDDECCQCCHCYKQITTVRPTIQTTTVAATSVQTTRMTTTVLSEHSQEGNYTTLNIHTSEDTTSSEHPSTTSEPTTGAATTTQFPFICGDANNCSHISANWTSMTTVWNNSCGPSINIGANIGAIIGGSLTGVVVLIASIVIAVRCCRKRKPPSRKSTLPDPWADGQRFDQAGQVGSSAPITGSNSTSPSSHGQESPVQTLDPPRRKQGAKQKPDQQSPISHEPEHQATPPTLHQAMPPTIYQATPPTFPHIESKQRSTENLQKKKKIDYVNIPVITPHNNLKENGLNQKPNHSYVNIPVTKQNREPRHEPSPADNQSNASTDDEEYVETDRPNDKQNNANRQRYYVNVEEAVNEANATKQQKRQQPNNNNNLPQPELYEQELYMAMQGPSDPGRPRVIAGRPFPSIVPSVSGINRGRMRTGQPSRKGASPPTVPSKPPSSRTAHYQPSTNWESPSEEIYQNST